MCSPTPRRPTPFAAPAGPRPATCWSVSPTRRRSKLGIDRAEIRRRNLDPARARCRTRRRSVRPMTAATFPKIFARALATRRLRRLRRSARREADAPRTAARHRHGLLRRIVGRRALALCRRARRARRLLRGGARSGSSRTARCAPCSAPTITARATPPPSRRSCRRGSACRSSNIEVSRGRHRCGPARHRHLRLALDRGRRLRARSRRATRSSPRAS